MAQGDSGLFDAIIEETFTSVNHDFDSDDWQVGLVDNTDAALMVPDTALPHWSGTGTNNLATNQVGTAAGYVGPIDVATHAFSDDGTGTFQWDLTFTQWAQNGSSDATDCYWAIIYNNTPASKRCAGWIHLSTTGLSIAAGSLDLTDHASGFFNIAIT